MGKGAIKIAPEPHDWQMQPVSIDLSLGAIRHSAVVDFPGWTYFIQPGQFLLGSTTEIIGLSPNIVGQVHGKSTLARQGLVVHAAGLVDPGFHGQLTLEMYNMSGEALELADGMPVCQITFEFLSTTPGRVYGAPGLFSKYQGQQGPTKAVEF